MTTISGIVPKINLLLWNVISAENEEESVEWEYTVNGNTMDSAVTLLETE
jgi:hypothetical protein